MTVMQFRASKSAAVNATKVIAVCAYSAVDDGRFGLNFLLRSLCLTAVGAKA